MLPVLRPDSNQNVVSGIQHRAGTSPAPWDYKSGAYPVCLSICKLHNHMIGVQVSKNYSGVE